MQILILLAILGGSVLLCKGIALAIVLLFTAIKNIRFRKDTAQWDRWFSGLTEHTITAYLVCWYLASIAITSAITYYILRACQFEYALAITVILLVVRLGISLYRYSTRKDLILEKFRRTVTK